MKRILTFLISVTFLLSVFSSIAFSYTIINSGTFIPKWTYYNFGTHGTWIVADSDTKLEFYTVKGCPNFSLFLLNPSAAAGDWTNEFLPDNSSNPPTISHFSGYTAAPVPEPATMFLLGSGLIGLAGLRRKFKR